MVAVIMKIFEHSVFYISMWNFELLLGLKISVLIDISPLKRIWPLLKKIIKKSFSTRVHYTYTVGYLNLTHMFFRIMWKCETSAQRLRDRQTDRHIWNGRTTVDQKSAHESSVQVSKLLHVSRFKLFIILFDPKLNCL